MFGFGGFGRVRRRTRRLLAAAGVALSLGYQAFSIAYIAQEADHDCDGEGCPVCVQLQQCVSNFQLTGAGLEADATAEFLPVCAVGRIVPADVVPQCRSLVSLKVRFNE